LGTKGNGVRNEEGYSGEDEEDLIGCEIILKRVAALQVFC
jgi:hypothetical protein